MTMAMQGLKLPLGLAIGTLAVFVSAASAAGTKTEGRISNERPDYAGLEAQVVKVIDADTLKLTVFLWPGQTIEANFRSRGIDAPELRRANCLEEKLLAEEARGSIAQKFPIGSWVYVDNIEPDKYGGRWLADIDRWASDRFTSLTEELLKSDGRWGVAWDGTGNGHNWCPAKDAE
jgi:endonuclease YncB( thermonuclease family)